MTVPIVLFAIGLVLALAAEFKARGESIGAWAIVFIAVGLLWGQLPK